MLTNLDRLWFNTLIRPSQESAVVYFVCRSFSLLQVQGCQTVSGSRLFVAERNHSYVMCATACFYMGYKVSYICDDEGDTAQEKCQRFLPPVSTTGCQAWYDVLLNPRITQA